MTEDLTEIIREARSIDAEIKDLAAKKDALVERIKAALAVGESVTVDGVAATHRPGNRRFEAKLALGMMDLDVQVKCIVKTIDEKLVRSFADQLGVTDKAMVDADPTKTVFKLAG